MAARDVRLSQLVLTGLPALRWTNRLTIDPIEGSRLTAMRRAIMTGQQAHSAMNFAQDKSGRSSSGWTTRRESARRIPEFMSELL